MAETSPAIIQLRPEGEGTSQTVRLEVAEISYGYGNGPTGGSAELIFLNAEGKMIFRVSMAESQLDTGIARAIYKATFAGQKRG